LKAGFVLVANCPTNSTPPVPRALPGSLLLIDSHGKLVETITNPVIQGPWDFTVQDEGNKVKVFVSNVVNGTVSRLDFFLNGNTFAVQSVAVIASNYTQRVDPATFEVGPTGLAYDKAKDILYVASTGNNEVFAIAKAGNRYDSVDKGLLIYADQVHLHRHWRW